MRLAQPHHAPPGADRGRRGLPRPLCPASCRRSRRRTSPPAGTASTPRGRLKVNAPMTFGFLHLGPLLPRVPDRHPAIQVELTLNDRVVDLLEEGFDLAVRIGRLADSSLIARRLATAGFVCAASAGLPRAAGTPGRSPPISPATTACATATAGSRRAGASAATGERVTVRVARQPRGQQRRRAACRGAGRPRHRLPARLHRRAPISPAASWCRLLADWDDAASCRSTPCSRRSGTRPPSCAPSSTSWRRASPAGSTGRAGCRAAAAPAGRALMFKDDLLAGRAHPDHRRRHRARQEHGPALPGAGRAARDLRPPRWTCWRPPPPSTARPPAARSRVFACDVRDADAVERMVAAAEAAAPVTALVNNAAGNFLARSEELSPRAVDAVVGIVLKGSLNCTLALGRRWLAAGPAAAPCSASSPATPGPARPTSCPRRWPRPACWR